MSGDHHGAFEFPVHAHVGPAAQVRHLVRVLGCSALSLSGARHALHTASRPSTTLCKAGKPCCALWRQLAPLPQQPGACSAAHSVPAGMLCHLAPGAERFVPSSALSVVFLWAQASKLFLRNMESSSLCSDSSVFSVQVPPPPSPILSSYHSVLWSPASPCIALAFALLSSFLWVPERHVGAVNGRA